MEAKIPVVLNVIGLSDDGSTKTVEQKVWFCDTRKSAVEMFDLILDDLLMDDFWEKPCADGVYGFSNKPQMEVELVVRKPWEA